MSAGKIIAYIAAAILIFFGVLFIWAAFSPTGQAGWILVGIISVAIGFVLIWFGSRKPKVEEPTNITYKVDLSGDINLDTIKCKSCGGGVDFREYQDGGRCASRHLPLLRNNLPNHRRTEMVI